jgi:hypothetical protein
MQANKFRIIQEVYNVKTFGTTQKGTSIDNAIYWEIFYDNCEIYSIKSHKLFAKVIRQQST